MLRLISRPIKLTNTGSSTNYNLHASVGSVSYPRDVFCFITGAITGTGSSPAFRTGLGWPGGTGLVITNSNTATGYAGTAGSSGAGGKGGNGGTAPAGPVAAAGASGSPGGNGTNGGIAFLADTVSNLRTVLNNGPGTLTGGTAGPAGSGGGGGGGGGGAGTTVVAPSKGIPGYTNYFGGGGGGGVDAGQDPLPARGHALRAAAVRSDADGLLPLQGRQARASGGEDHAAAVYRVHERRVLAGRDQSARDDAARRAHRRRREDGYR